MCVVQAFCNGTSLLSPEGTLTLKEWLDCHTLTSFITMKYEYRLPAYGMGAELQEK